MMSQIDLSWRLVSVVVALGLAGPALAQGRVKPGTRVPATSAAIVLEGSAWLPDGAPAEGAVVVTSAGGRAVVDAEGRYRIETGMPLEAERVQVMAVGAAAASLTASTSVELGATDGSAEVEPLLLTTGLGCQPDWLPTFGGMPGTDGEVFALTVFDDGGGPALYAGGGFSTAGGVTASRIAKWDGSSWSALGSGVNSNVRALTVYDDGSGPALYAGGSFTTAGGVPASRIAKWNGSSWAALGSGTGGGGLFGAEVLALTVYDDGSGPALYAGGFFITAGGVPANRIAKWNGASWAALGSGMNAVVRALTVYDDGSGPALYAGGSFTTAGGSSRNRIAKWNGASWVALGSGLNNVVLALTVYDDGSGPALHAGGDFLLAGGVAANRIAKWNGAGWTALGSGMGSTVRALTVYDDGSGPALNAGGDFTTAGGVPANRIAKWNGSSWAALGSGLGGAAIATLSAHALTVYDDGSGPVLHAGGDFTIAGGMTANRVAEWDGSSWAALGSGLNDAVLALTAYDDGSGPTLFSGGYFTSAGAMAANRIAEWDGSSWATLGSGLMEFIFLPSSAAEALTVYDDGNGLALYTGGGFTSAGGVPANRIAKWDGSSWAGLGSGMNDRVTALTVYDGGGGPALHAGGHFTTAGGIAANHIAEWNGSSWAALGGGLNDNALALTVHDDGSGPALHAGGDFTGAGTVPANGIAKWNGSHWAALGSGLGAGAGGTLSANAVTVYDDGSGPALYAGGGFTTADGMAANRIAKWDGSSWAALGSGMGGSFPDVHALTVYDDGSGPALYAGGSFSFAGGVSAGRIAKWNGSSWAALGSGIGNSSNAVHALTVYNDGSGPALYAGGNFSTAGSVAASRIAKWNGSSWAALGSGIGGFSFTTAVHALTVYDDGSGPALYVGGDFIGAGGVPASRIAKWNGSSWAALGSGMNSSSTVHALTVYDDGSGPALYAGGTFTTAGGVPANHIAKWNGSSWAALGNGMDSTVHALRVYDDGSGPALYAGGDFQTAGGVQANRIARWDGSSWSASGIGVNSVVLALTVYDDGSGPALYPGGSFTTAEVPASRIARWNGSSWAALGSGMNSIVFALTVHDDGGGPALYAGGYFTTAGGVAARCIARWNGSSWGTLGSGVGGGLNPTVEALTVYDDGSGPPALYAGGYFPASPAGDSFIAKWGCLAACTTYQLDFQTEDDFATPLTNGQSIDSEFGALVVISATGANSGPAIFDSTPGGPNDPALNDDMLIGRGNVLLLEDDWYGWSHSVPGYFDVVTDDPDGGELVFDFTAPVDPRGIQLADINPAPNLGALVTLHDEDGRTRVYDVEPGWTGTYGDAGPHRLNLTTLAPQPGNGTPRLATATESPGFLQARVVKLVVYLSGYGAVDELEFCR